MPAVFLARLEDPYRSESRGTLRPAAILLPANLGPPLLLPPHHQPAYRPIRPPEQLANRLIVVYLEQRLRQHP